MRYFAMTLLGGPLHGFTGEVKGTLRCVRAAALLATTREHVYANGGAYWAVINDEARDAVTTVDAAALERDAHVLVETVLGAEVWTLMVRRRGDHE